jgi:cell division protein FtsQ
MDGGRRLLRSLTGAVAAPVPQPAYAGVRAIQVAPVRAAMPLPKRMPRRRRQYGAFARLERLVPRFAGTGLLLGLLAATGLYGSVVGGQYDGFVATYGEPRHVAARLLGFGIDEVTISGLVEMNEVEVLQAAGIDPRVSLAFLDAAQVRERLKNVPMIKEAEVRKLYPSSLTIALTEREPFALWQHGGDVFVIAADGSVIDRLDDARYNSLPLVVGEGAAQRAAAFATLMDSHPEVKAHVRAGVLSGGRRWNLKLDNGINVRLPEEGTAAALDRLAAMMKDQRILEKDILSLDLRQPDRVVIRLTEEAADARAEALKAKLKAKGGAT